MNLEKQQEKGRRGAQPVSHHMAALAPAARRAAAAVRGCHRPLRDLVVHQLSILGRGALAAASGTARRKRAGWSCKSPPRVSRALAVPHQQIVALPLAAGQPE